MKVQFFHTTCPLKKLADKCLGPYEVIAQPGTHSVTLRLPDNLCTIHPVFHISMLEPTTLNTIPDRVQPPPLPIFVDGEPEFEITEILNSKVDQRRHSCKLLYLIHWTGYASTDEETSWILAMELGNAPELVGHLNWSGTRIGRAPELVVHPNWSGTRIGQAPELVADYHMAYPAKPGRLHQV